MFQRPGDAALAQRSLLEQKLKVAMMPTPRDISVSCGLSLRFSLQDADSVRAALCELFPEPERCSFFLSCTEQGRRTFRPAVLTEEAGNERDPAIAPETV